MHTSSFPSAQEINEDLEPYTPTNLVCEPARGTLRARTSAGPYPPQKFTLTFSPTQALDQIECGVWVKSDKFAAIFGVVRGVAGTRELKLDSESRVIDFDTCRVGAVFSRTLWVSNAGNIPCAFEVGPDLSDPAFVRALALNSVGTAAVLSPPASASLSSPKSFTPAASNAASSAGVPPALTSPRSSTELVPASALVTSVSASTPTAAGSSGSRAQVGIDSALARRTWLALLETNGLDVHSNGLCPAYGRTAIRFVFTPTEARAVSVKLRVSHAAGKYELLEVRGRGATAELRLYEERSRPFPKDGKSLLLLISNLLLGIALIRILSLFIVG